MAETIEGRVERVFFAQPDGSWMAGALRDNDGARVSFAGAVCANIGDKVTLVGKWVRHPKYGMQFDVESGGAEIDESPDGLAQILSSSKEFAGVGDVRAEKLVAAATAVAERNGTGVVEAMIEHADSVSTASGVQADIVTLASGLLRDKRDHYKSLAALVAQGWTNAQAAKLHTLFGANAVKIVERDPYMLVGKVERFGFRTVDTIALQLGADRNGIERAKAGVAYCIDRETSDGHTWVEREALLNAAKNELQPDTLEGEDAVSDALDELVSAGLVVSTTSPTTGETILASHALATKEVSIFKMLKAWMRDESDPLFKLEDFPPKSLGLLNEGQRSALEGVSRFRCSVISGAAGTGKTFTMRAIVDAAEQAGVPVALCAPTGKAAKKLSLSTGKEASTIHRLLEPAPALDGSGGFVFKRNASNPLEERLVVVDECSMCDVPLMWSLLTALDDNAHLLLVGDHNQIPSVGAGAILRDLLAGGARKFPGAVHVLSHVVRQAGVLAKNTTAILDGIVATESSPAWAINRTDKTSSGTVADVVKLVEFITTSPEPLAPFGRALDPAWDIQVISPIRKGPQGIYALNVELQRLRQRLLGNMPPPATPPNKQPRPMVGDRVIWTKNDYDLGLFNGTQAIVQKIVKGGPMHLLTEDNREVEVENSKRVNVEIAYALSIHKCQGSQWPCVILVASSAHFIMHDRNLLYTGASRAAESLTIVGDWKGIRSFATQRRSDARRTLGSFMVADDAWNPGV